jgi:hypothetical protein
MTAFALLLVGLLLGMKHATEADHLAAVATLATRQGSVAKTLRQGVAWGVGHTLTLLAFGGAVLLLGQVISPRLGQGLESDVGIMLVVLGADVLRRLVRDRIHFDFHLRRHGPTPCTWTRTVSAAKARTPTRRTVVRMRRGPGRRVRSRSA